MTDKKFQDLIYKTCKSKLQHLRLLDKAEDEYIRRYGNHPSDIDDDYWIDGMHTSLDSVMRVVKIEESALSCKKRYYE